MALVEEILAAIRTGLANGKRCGGNGRTVFKAATKPVTSCSLEDAERGRLLRQ